MVTTCAKKEIPPIPLGDDEKIVWVSPYFARVEWWKTVYKFGGATIDERLETAL